VKIYAQDLYKCVTLLKINRKEVKYVRFNFAKFRNNFHFYFAIFRENKVTKFREISRNKIKISRNTKLIFGAKFRIAKFRIHPSIGLFVALDRERLWKMAQNCYMGNHKYCFDSEHQGLF
jgi:hypothetical protein